MVAAIVDKEEYDDVARRFRVSKRLVETLVSKVKRKKLVLDELLAKEMEKSGKDNEIIDTIESMMA